MCFIWLEGVLTSFFLYFRSCDHLLTYIVLIFLYMWMDVFFSFTYLLHVLFLFFLYAHASYYVYTIYYFYFTLRCLDGFCLKYFRNTGCQSLLAINSLLTKLFKSLCYDRFYCIQQVSMSWVIYDFSHIFICLLWFCHGLPKGEIVRTYVIHLLETYITILCNWLILWENALYLYLGRSRMCLILQETLFQVQVLKSCKSVQESSEKVLNFKAR